MRFNHYIAIVRLDNGEKIAYHCTGEGKPPKDKIKYFVGEFSKLFPEELIASHRLTTDEMSWSSVVRSDRFFDDVFPFENLDNFLKEIVDKNGYL